MTELRVFSLRIPNPFVEGRSCVYVIAADPVTVIDTGIATSRAFDALVEGLKEHDLSLGDVKRVILTHKHIDHIGNAWRIQQQSGAEIFIHQSELHAVNDVDPGGGRHTELVRKRLDEWNVPEDARPQQSAGSRPTWEIESAEAQGVSEGHRFAFDGGELEVVHTPGHTMGSICLRHKDSLFSGDHILPNISPNVGGGDMRQRELLRHYLDSLKRTLDLADEGLRVFPGHGDPFDTLAERCRELLEHHDQRLERVIEILEDGQLQTVYEIARRLFGDMENFHVVLGCAEAASHLEYLGHAGRVTAEEGRYRLAAASHDNSS